MKKVTIILMAFLTLTLTANAQWSLQTNPLTGNNSLGKIQFVSATEGWIACGSNGSLLHTTNAGANWNIVTPFPGDSVGNMSDPATTMNWANPMHGWALKTFGTFTDNFDNENGAVLYKTIDGGSTWSRNIFPKSVVTANYRTADLHGTWQMHELVAANNTSYSSNTWAGWSHGTLTLDANGNGTFTGMTKSSDITDYPSSVSLSLTSNGILSVGGDIHGFMSTDKNTFFMTTTDGGGGYGLGVMQRVASGVTYTTSDLQGTWQIHQLVTANPASSNQYAGWIYGSIAIDSNGNGVATFVKPDGSKSQNIAVSISSDGTLLMNGTDFHGFMSADKKSICITMTDGGSDGYDLMVMQKVNPATSYATIDLQGKWQTHALTTSNASIYSLNQQSGWSHGTITLNANGEGNTNIISSNNNNSNNNQPGDNISLSISSDGLVTTSGKDIHGFMSADKSSILITMTEANGGYTLAVMQKDLSTSGDVGLQVQFANETNGWASIYNMIYGNFQLYKTTDGGSTWNPTNSNAGGFFQFMDASNGWMLGTTIANVGEGNLNNIYHTTDGGSTWLLQATNIGKANALCFSDLTHGWVVGESGLVLKTTDGGTNWTAVTTTSQTSNSHSKTVYFLDAKTGWIGSGESKTDGVGTQFVLATKDGGATWKTQVTPVTNGIFSISFWDATNGWFTSDYGQIAHYIAPKTVLIAAGGLSSALTTTEKATLTDFIVTGNMDARDFRIIRDSMPLLANLDLSEANVVAYVGSEGTVSNNYSYPVNTIPRNALLQKTSLLSIVFPNTLTSVGRSGLNGCTALSSVALPSTLVTIDTMSFRSCTELKNVNIPLNVTEIGYAAFFATGLQQITLNEGLKKIGDYAFQDCHSLQSISIPSTVTEIGYAAFLAAGLQQITLKEGLKKIGDYAFIYCYPLQSISIPSTVTEIGNGAFNSSGLQQITLKEGLKTIGDYAFQWCDSLRSITIPSTVTNIGYCAFTFVNSLETITVASGNSNYYSEAGVLFDKAKKRLLAYPAKKSPHYDIPLGITVIDTAAFEGNWSLRSVTIPSSVTDLAPEAFYHCDLLNVIDLPSSISKIGNYCFYACYNLSAIFTNTQTPLSMAVSDSIFKEINAGCTLYAPKGSLANYQSSEGWNHYISRIKEYEKITDNEGNVYHGIQVGSQVWLVENLRTKHYNNNDSIPTPWDANTDLTYNPGAEYRWDIDKDRSNNYVYGRLYTWNAATDSRGICPVGWRMPSISDVQTMTAYVTNNSNTSTTKALASNSLWWENPDAPENTPSYNMSTNNESGLLFFPSGIRHTEGGFEGLWSVTFLWSSGIQNGLPYAYNIGIYATSVNGGPNRAQEGFSVRCMRDGIVALGDVENDGKISVYPNPTSEAFQIKGIMGTATATVSDLNGRILISKEITANESVSVGALSNGMYLITIKLNNTKTTEKLIIQH